MIRIKLGMLTFSRLFEDDKSTFSQNTGVKEKNQIGGFLLS